MSYVHAHILPIDNRKTFKHAFRFLRGWPGALSTHHTWRAIVRPDMYVHTIVSQSPWGHGSVALDRRHCKNEWVHSFCWFLPNPFIQDLFLWHTRQEIVKTDLYPLSQGLWFLSSMLSVWQIGYCVGACQRSSWRKTTVLSMRKGVYWLSRLFLMARNFVRLFTENNPTQGTGKIIIFLTWTKIASMSILTLFESRSWKWKVPFYK